MMRSARKVLLTMLIVGAAALLALGALLWTEWGLARVAGWVAAGVSSGIAGTLEIAHIDELTLTQVRARGVTISDPDGRPAIEAERAIIEFSPRAFLAGRMGWERARIDGCRVRLTEREKGGKLNMEETFRSPEPKKPKEEGDKEKEEGSDLDLREMATSRCVLLIEGGSLPKLRLVDLEGVMRVHVLPSGDVELRFDGYSGTIEDGLPTGVLAFRDVQGEVTPAAKRLLHFDGGGRSEGEKVEFKLDIFTKPEKKVKIGAVFPELSGPSLRAFAIGVWSRFSSSLELDVRHGRGKPD